jgi:hypothetical protein
VACSPLHFKFNSIGKKDTGSFRVSNCRLDSKVSPDCFSPDWMPKRKDRPGTPGPAVLIG